MQCTILRSRVYQSLPIVIVSLICIFSYNLLKLPILVSQYNQVRQISKQAQYPLSENMAKQLLEQPIVTKIEYFRLLNAYQAEYKGIKVYPAVRADNR